MINMIVTGQELSIVTARVVSGTHNYLEVNGDFRTSDWTGLRKWVHFTMGEFNYVMPMVNDKIQAEQHLDLTEGTWEVYIHGNLLSDDEVTERVTTDVKLLFVDAPHTGHPFPPLTPDFEEVLANRVEHAVDVAESVREDADDGEFDGATYLPSVDNTTGDISWTNDKGKANPPTRNIKGPKGDTGDPAVYVGENEPTDPKVNVWIKPSALGGKVITSFTLVSGTHAPGTYDNYRIEFSDGDPLTFSVYNGADGSGIGDMIKSVYDSHNKAQDIFDYADSKVAAVKDTTTKTGILKGSGGSIVAAVAGTDYQTPLIAGTDYQTPLTIDSSMSSSSTNTVQNKVIKTYVDNAVSSNGQLFVVTPQVTTYAQIAAAIVADKIPILVDKSKAMYGTMVSGTTYSSGETPSRDYYVFLTTVAFEENDEGRHNPGFKYVIVNDDDEWTISSSGSYDGIITYEKVLQTIIGSGYGSTYPASSVAVYNAIQAAKVTVDSALSSSSTNPVQNRVIYNALNGLGGGSFIKPVTFTLQFANATIGTEYDASTVQNIPSVSGYNCVGFGACSSIVGLISKGTLNFILPSSYTLDSNGFYNAIGSAQASIHYIPTASSGTITLTVQAIYKKQ